MLLLKEALRRYFTKKIYPTYRGDWYKLKGYIGASHQLRFADFITRQKSPNSLYYQEFKNLKLVRKFIASSKFELDTVRIKPNKIVSRNKPGKNLYIVCFQGRNEYYESRFRDMALMAKETGATVIGFNPKGFHSSTGKTKTILDLVDDGIVLTESLLAENILPTQIIFYGNSLGAAVQTLVCNHFQKLKSINFRQINSNSFRSLAAVFSTKFKISFLEKQLYTIMKYAGWEINYDKDFYKIGIYRCYLTRAHDRTIPSSASFGAAINPLPDIKNSPENYQETLKWLIYNSELIVDSSTLTQKSLKDPHNLSLYNLCLNSANNQGKHLKVWEFFNKYFEASNQFI